MGIAIDQPPKPRWSCGRAHAKRVDRSLIHAPLETGSKTEGEWSEQVVLVLITELLHN